MIPFSHINHNQYAIKTSENINHYRNLFFKIIFLLKLFTGVMEHTVTKVEAIGKYAVISKRKAGKIHGAL